jgi:hypothetical protein
MKILEMTLKKMPAVLLMMITLAILVRMALADQDKWTVKVPNGISFSELKGYENWEDVAVSQTNTSVKAILANPKMIQVYREGIPGNGKDLPDGSKVVRIEWLKKQNTESPYPVWVPDKPKSVSFIEKDSKRFTDTSGWRQAQFLFDPQTKTFKAFGKDAFLGKKVCYQCHTIVKAKDYIFTTYPVR